jgi:hypothetical protein
METMIEDGRIDTSLRYARADFMKALYKHAKNEPLEVGRQYVFKHYTGIGSHVNLKRVATQADIDLVMAGVMAGDASLLPEG